MKTRRVATWQQRRRLYLTTAWINVFVIVASAISLISSPLGLLGLPSVIFAWWFFDQAKAEAEVRCPYQEYYDREQEQKAERKAERMKTR
jgi:hypothetical protein